MKRIYYIPLVCAVLAFASCSTYKNSQTPDDVYYSPGNSKQAAASQSHSQNSNSEYYSTSNDNYVQMRVQDPARWSYFDNYNNDYYGGFGPSCFASTGYFMSPWVGGFGYYSPFSYWNSYYTWNSFYNPYYPGVVVVNPKVGSSVTYTRLSTFNPGSYTNTTYTRQNTRSTNAKSSYNYSQTIRNNYTTPNNYATRPVYSGSRPVNNTFSTQPTRTFSPSSFGGHMGGGGGGGGAMHSGGFGRPGR
ncbi:MAG: hypothetical protein C5B59_05235 [Bacteroidetes bacterium]|nr:MAG: hypothetical protein C5B59_05235 [Bacteroidota bacterium]